MTFRIALRNVFRNRRRTAFSLAVIVVGTSIFLFVLGFIGEALRSTQLTLACETGAVQVADARFFENDADGYDYLILPTALSRVLEEIAQLPGVVEVSERLDFAGLVGDEDGSSLIIGRGSTPYTPVRDAQCLSTAGLPEDDSREIVVGAALAKKLGVDVGDRINIATGTVSGNFNAATVEIVDKVTYSISDVEEQLGLFSLAFVQRLLKTDGIERIQIGLENLDDADAFAAALQQRLDAEGIPLATRTWKQLNPSYESLQSFYAAFSGLAGLAVFVLVFFSVVEVLTISFLERTREIGTVRAFGTPRGLVFRTFLLEGVLLGAIGATLGAVLGGLITVVFNAIGFGWTPPGAAAAQTLRLSLNAATVLTPLVTSLLATTVSSVYPALKSSRQRIVDALRSV
jgi:putative ABC transport system permease protein